MKTIRFSPHAEANLAAREIPRTEVGAKLIDCIGLFEPDPRVRVIFSAGEQPNT